jgi:very-short-patch-repair endonuclease
MSVFHRPENIAREYFATYFAGRRMEFQHNKTIPGTWFRPDFLFTNDHIAVVVECDEEYHHSYNKSDEIYREHAIAQRLASMGYRSIYILRFTPHFTHAPRTGIVTRDASSYLERVADTITNLLERRPIRDVGVHLDDRRRLFTKLQM